jgi:hypothetical protein
MIMGKTLFKWSCYLTAGFVFVWVSLVWSHFTDWYSVAGFVLLGIFFYAGTHWGLGSVLNWTMWFCAALWSFFVFAIFVGSAQLNLPLGSPKMSDVPIWMQVAGPFVYAATPLIILWGTRLVLMYLDK